MVANQRVGRLNLIVGGRCSLVHKSSLFEMKTMNFRCLRIALACLVASSFVLMAGSTVVAQCATCATPTVAYSPVVAQPVYTGWYPGRFFDRMRMRRYGVSTAPATYTAAYAPYTTAYAPTYTTSYTPYTAAYAYTAAYRPYVTSYAPLSYTTNYAVARQVVMSPVVSSCNACGCDPCTCNPCGCGLSACDSCSTCATSSCSSCSGGVGQAIYSQPSTGCSSCAENRGTPSYSSQPSVGPQTPQPTLAPNEPVPGSTGYDTQRPLRDESTNDPKPLAEEDASTYLEAPRLFDPQDLTASRGPTVEVRQAVYKQSAQTRNVSHAPAVDANGWYAVPASR